MSRKTQKNIGESLIDEDIELTIGDISNFNYKIATLKFKNKKQKQFFDICRDEDTKLVICDGPAGTGKTILSFYSALKMLRSKDNNYESILYVRTPVDSSDTGIGYLPGDLKEKSYNYMLPLYEKLEKFLEKDKIKELLSRGIIESDVNTFMRGRSIDNTIVIVDEIQNYSMREVKTLLSRFEENTKIIALGDHAQSDIGLNSSLSKLLIMFSDESEKVESEKNGVFTFTFDIEDVVRSELTKFILQKFDKYEKVARRS
jgi:phosphate starvation-inducible PhoH-like protein